MGLENASNAALVLQLAPLARLVEKILGEPVSTCYSSHES
jgi:hypothetical protein